ncbi:MAG: ABC transporter permease, partial [Lachnospiraceae bacterium]|nr:ABC transporter permease [Lachnospiraceae bacterium]
MKKFIMKFYVGIIFLFLYIPIFTLIGLSFNASLSRSVWGGFTLEWYTSLFANSTILNALRNTLVIALLSSVIATIIALLAVISMTKMHYVPRKVITGFGDIPMLNADIVTGIILMLLLSTFFRLGFASILLAHITFNIPYCFLSIYPKYRSVNFSVYESALDLGAGPFYAFIKVVLPEIMPGIVSGMIMAITLSMDDFVVTYFTKGA